MAIGNLKVLLGLDAAEFTSGLSKAEAQAKKFAESQRRNQTAIDRQVSAFQAQAAALGRSTNEQKLFELAQKGATATQLKSADAALRQVDAHEKLISQSRFLGRALGVAAAVGAGAFVAFTKGAIDAADHLNDLSKKTGVAVETLGGIGFAGKQAGIDLDSAAAAVGKLNKAIAAAASGDKEAFEPFKLLGISIKELESSNPDEILKRIADRFKGFEDGPNKAALALKIFGKAGADMIPLLNEGGAALQAQIEYFKKYSGVTAQVAADSDAFNDSMVKVGLIVSSVGTEIASKLLTTLDALAKAMLRAREEGSLFDKVSNALAGTLQFLATATATVSAGFDYFGRILGGGVAQLFALVKGDAKGYSAISDAFKEDNAKALSGLKKFSDDVMGVTKGINDRSSQRLKRQGSATGPPVLTRAPSMSSGGGGGSKKDDAAAILKKQLDGQIKAIRDFADQQKEGYDFANRYVEGAYAQGIVGLQEFLDTQKRLRDASLEATVAALDKEIALQQSAAKKLKGTQRVEADTQIQEALAKRAAAFQKAGREEFLAGQQSAAITDQVRERYEDLLATVMELKGETAGAIKIRIERQVEDARKTAFAFSGDEGAAKSTANQLRLELEGARAKEVKQRYDELRATIKELRGETAEAIQIRIDAQVVDAKKIVKDAGGDAQDVQRFRAGLEGNAALSKAQDDYNKLLERARNIEEDIMLTAQAAGTAEIDVLRQVGAARAQSLVQLGAMADKARELAKELNTDDARAFADALARGFKLAALAVDPLQDKIKAIGDEIGKAFDFTDAITSAKSFDDVLSNIAKKIRDIIIEEAVNKPLQKSISNLINGNSGGSSGGGGGNLWGTLASWAIGAFAGGGGGFTAGGTQGMSWSYPKAAGGYARPGSIQRVNERGPEMLDVSGKQYLMMGSRGGTVTPNGGAGRAGARTTILNYHAAAGESRASSNQRMADGARFLARADARNN